MLKVLLAWEADTYWNTLKKECCLCLFFSLGCCCWSSGSWSWRAFWRKPQRGTVSFLRAAVGQAGTPRSLPVVSGPPSIWICTAWRFWDGIWTLPAVHLGNWQYQRCNPFSKIYSFVSFIAGRLVKENHTSGGTAHEHTRENACLNCRNAGVFNM